MDLVCFHHDCSALCRPTRGPPWSVDDSHWHLPSRRLRLAESKPVQKGTATGPRGSADPPSPTSNAPSRQSGDVPVPRPITSFRY